MRPQEPGVKERPGRPTGQEVPNQQTNDDDDDDDGDDQSDSSEDDDDDEDAHGTAPDGYGPHLFILQMELQRTLIFYFTNTAVACFQSIDCFEILIFHNLALMIQPTMNILM